MAKVFRGKFLEGLEKAFDAEQLRFPGQISYLAAPRAFADLFRKASRHKWVVYTKRPFGGPTLVFRYLGRYSHRVAISNSRLVSVDEGQVSFQWKDYADGHQTKVMSLAAEEFLRRFLLHVLPKGFVRIRHYGLLASVNVATKLVRCRQLLGQEAPLTPPSCKSWIDRVLEWTGQDPMRCPHCQGVLERRALTKSPSSTSPPSPAPTPLGANVAAEDSS